MRFSTANPGARQRDADRFSLANVRVLSLESRMRSEMAKLLAKYGAIVTQAPSMQEVALEDLSEAREFAVVLEQAQCDVLILMTGVGAEVLFNAMCTSRDKQSVQSLLDDVDLVCRGPKPVATLKRWQLKPHLVAPEPNTSESLLTAMQAMPVAGRRIYVQEYGSPASEVISALSKRGANVERLPVYAWKMPDDVGPLTNAALDLTQRRQDVLIVTSARQVTHLFAIAEGKGLVDRLTQALREQVVVCSIGPVASKALKQHGVEPDAEPDHPKMGHLARHLAREWSRLKTKSAG